MSTRRRVRSALRGWKGPGLVTARVWVAVVIAVAGVAACTRGAGEGIGPTPSSVAVISAPPPSVAPSPSPSAEVVLPKGLSAEEREAALEAVDAYKRFVAASDRSSQSGGRETDDLLAIATRDALKASLAVAAHDREVKSHLIGQTIIRKISVEHVKTASAEDTPEVLLQTCEDMTTSRYVDDKGVSRRNPNTPLYWEYKLWVRRYPNEGGWLVADWLNREASSC